MNYGDHNFIEITQQTKLRVAPVVSSQSRSTCRARRASRASRARRVERVELCCSTMSTQPKCMGSTRRTCRVVSSRASGIWAYTSNMEAAYNYCTHNSATVAPCRTTSKNANAFFSKVHVQYWQQTRWPVWPDHASTSPAALASCTTANIFQAGSTGISVSEGSCPDVSVSDSLRHVADLPRRQRLRSASSADLAVPQTRLQTVGDRAFCIAAAKTWNSLPSEVTSSVTLSTFKQKLKTYLFSLSFPGT